MLTVVCGVALACGGAALLGATAELIVGSLAALLAGATLYAQLSGQTPLAPAPELDVEVEVTGPGTLLADQGMPVIEVDAIVQGELDAIRASVPQPRRPGVISTFAFTDPLREQQLAATREGIEKALPEYERDLREWLNDYERTLWAVSAEVRIRLVVRNRGKVKAEHVEVELMVPPGLAPSSRVLASIDPPPAQPSDSLFTSWHIAGAIPKIREYARSSHLIQRGDSYEWTFRPRAPIHAQADDVSHDEYLLPSGPGTFELRWIARAANQRIPAEGVLKITIDGPRREFTSLSDLVANGGLDPKR